MPIKHVASIDSKLRKPFSARMDRWFADGELNTAYLALDFHIEQVRDEQPALIYDSPFSGNKKVFSYMQLRDEVARFAGVLRANGVDKGDDMVQSLDAVNICSLAIAQVIGQIGGGQK